MPSTVSPMSIPRFTLISIITNQIPKVFSKQTFQIHNIQVTQQSLQSDHQSVFIPSEYNSFNDYDDFSKFQLGPDSSQNIDYERFSSPDFSSNFIEVDFSARSKRSTGNENDDNEGSGFETNFEVFLVVGSEEESSPLNSFHEDLLDDTTELYQQAVEEAIDVIKNFMDKVVGNLGLAGYEIVILGFTDPTKEATEGQRRKRSLEAPVGVLFEIIFDNAEVSASSHDITADSVQESIETVIVTSSEPADGNSTPDSGSDSYKLTLNHVVGSQPDPTPALTCPSCWHESQGKCVPDLSRMKLSCGPEKMLLQVEKCIMGSTFLNLLSLNENSCGAGSSHISEVSDGGVDYYLADIGLDECSTSMQIYDDLIIFKNNLIGGFDSEAIISSVDRNNIEFSCKYATQYNNIGDSAIIQSSINSGDTGNLGQLGFSLKIFTDQYFTKEASFSSMFYVGSKLNFGIEILQEIPDINFSVMDCVVKNKEHGLEYGILNNKCANKRVKFRIFDNLDSKLTKFSYRVFEFRQAKARSLHLSCNVLVCDRNDPNSKCAAEPVCGGRKRRSTELESGDQIFRISRDFLVEGEN